MITKLGIQPDKKYDPKQYVYRISITYQHIKNKDEKGDYIITTLGALANTGMLSVNDVDSNGKKIVINPKDNTDISSCNIKITKTVDTNYKVTYNISSNISSSDCPYINESIN